MCEHVTESFDRANTRIPCPFSCDVNGMIDVTISIQTDNNITTQTNVFGALNNATGNLGVSLYSIGKCRNTSREWTLEAKFNPCSSTCCSD